MHNPQQSTPSILNMVNMEAIEEFCRQIYYCDPYTSIHAEHVAELMAGLAHQMCMSADEINLAYIVGLIHDVGKIKIPNDILTKPGPLTEEEFRIMKMHSEYGVQILAGIDGAEAVVPIIGHHHERYDGRGYPAGLAGDSIPLLSRMLTLSDAFDAMTTNRCYRRPVSLEECIAEIRCSAGTQFDPKICDLFIEFLEARFGIIAVTGAKK